MPSKGLAEPNAIGVKPRVDQGFRQLGRLKLGCATHKQCPATAAHANGLRGQADRLGMGFQSICPIPHHRKSHVGNGFEVIAPAHPATGLTGGEQLIGWQRRIVSLELRIFKDGLGRDRLGWHGHNKPGGSAREAGHGLADPGDQGRLAEQKKRNVCTERQADL